MPPVLITGEGRLVSNVGNHNADPKNFVVFKDLYIDDAGLIRKRPGIGTAKGSAAAAAVTAMHEYVYTNPTTGAKTRWLFRATDQVIQYYNRGTNAWVDITWPASYAATAGGLWVFENVPRGATAVCLACNGKDAMIVFDGTDWRVAGVDGPVSAMAYALGGIYGFSGSFGGVTTVNCTKGLKTIAGVGGTTWLSFLEGPIVAGMKIKINGNTYEVASVATDTSLNITEEFKEATAVGLPYQIYYGALSWERAPRAGYAYEDPNTGHISNLRSSSLTSENVTEVAEQDQSGRKLTWNNIVYSPAAYAQGYTKIRLFRSAKNARILQALDTTINNSAGAGSTTFPETASTFVDTYLLPWEASATKFGKPPAGALAVKYHQGRAFLLTHTRLYYSLHEGDVIGQLGVAVLSWPASQWKSVNEPRGLVTLGSRSADAALVIQTADGDFAVVGYDQLTLDLVELPTRKSETYQYAAIGTQGRLVSFDGDLRVTSWPDETDYGLDIQDKLSAIDVTLLSGVRLHRFTYRSHDLLLLSVPKADASTTNDVTYVYDLDLQKWYEWTVGFTSFCTAKNPTTGERELWASSSTGKSFMLLQANQWQDEGVSFSPTLKTSMLWPTGQFVEADLEEIQGFVSDVAVAWTGELLIKGQADGAGQSFQLKAPRHFDAMHPLKLEFRPSSSTRTQSQPFQLSLTFPATSTDLYFELVAIELQQATAR